MSKSKIKILNKDAIVSMYVDYVLTNDKKSNSVYEFAKVNGFTESDFYNYFASFAALEEQFMSDMFQYSLELLAKTTAYETYDAAQKLSCFYFTFFELATANRSFMVYLLKQKAHALKNNSYVIKLRPAFINYIKTILETPFKTENQKITNIQNRLVNEGAWIQFLALFHYWLNDTSSNFEKTDVFIEKSVKASFDMVYNVPIESIVDFGKFLWKEKFSAFNSNN